MLNVILNGDFMSRRTSPLDNIKIASPCSANWNEMFGNDRMRFCGECKLNVYNLSGMTRDDAENLISNAEGRLCVRFYRRMDGTIITQNCPVGWAKVKARTKVYATAAFSLIMTFLGGLFFVSLFTKRPTRPEVGKVVVQPVEKVQPVMGAVAPNVNKTEMRPAYEVGQMGDVDRTYLRENVGVAANKKTRSVR